MNINEKIKKLRELMKENNIDYYYIPTDDYHMSEYVGDYFKERAYMSGFNGSAGVMLISLDEAFLWTDGRYFLQAESDLKNTCITLMKIGEPNVATVFEVLEKEKTLKRIAFDGRCVPISFGETLSNIKNLEVIYDINLIDSIWKDRPEQSKEKAFMLDIKYAGKDRDIKIKDFKEELKKLGATLSIITSLDDICWLLNIRGNDVMSTPVVLSYLLIKNDIMYLYTDSTKFDLEIIEKLHNSNVQIRDYNQIYSDLKKLKGETILLDKGKTNYALYKSIDLNYNKIIDHMNLTEEPKSIKNEIEIKNMRYAHILDAVSVIKTIKYVKENASKGITELSVVNYLHEMRSLHSSFIEDSFETIAGFSYHGAIVHYEPTKETDIEILKDNFLLLDSGGHYLEGTTDITRTIATGKVTKEMKRDFTLVLKGYLALSDAIFKEGTKGVTLDMLARKPLWDNLLDFNHGTGHGVGYLLNVHEGPQGIKYNRYFHTEFKEGQITSDEPGLYKEGEYGIRHESLVLTKFKCENSFGRFLEFEPITLVPFDISAIDKTLLSVDEVNKLNNYHKLVYKKISPYLDGADLEFLKKQCKEI